MPSPKRVHRRNFHDPGHAHELTFSCYRNFEFLKAERTCLWLIEAINAARLKHDVAVWAYVFMPEHVQLLISPRRADYDISAIRQAIKEPVARNAVRYLKKDSPAWLLHDSKRREDASSILAKRGWLRSQYHRTCNASEND